MVKKWSVDEPARWAGLNAILCKRAVGRETQVCVPIGQGRGFKESCEVMVGRGHLLVELSCEVAPGRGHLTFEESFRGVVKVTHGMNAC